MNFKLLLISTFVTLWAGSGLSANILNFTIDYTANVRDNDMAASTMLSDIPEFGADPFPDIDIDLSTSTTLTLRFAAPIGQQFQWTPSTDDGAEYILNSLISYGDEPFDDFFLDTVSVSFENLVGDEPFIEGVAALFGTDGDFIEIFNCGCAFGVTGPSQFTAFVITIDYSSMDTSGWGPETLSSDGFSNLSFYSIDVALDDPELVLTAIPEPAHLAFVFGLVTVAALLARKRAAVGQSPPAC